MRRASYFFVLTSLITGLAACEAATPPLDPSDASVLPEPDAEVPPPGPAIITFEASAPSVRRGTSVELRWKVENAQRVILSTPTEVFLDTDQTEGVVQTSPLEHRSRFSLRATGVGSANQSVDVDVTWPDPTIKSFAADPSPTAVQYTMISWETEYAEEVSVYMNGDPTAILTVSGRQAEAGNMFVGLAVGEATFQMSAKNPAGTATRDLTVLSLPPPVITSFRASPHTFVETSTHVTLTWETEGFDSIEVSQNFMPIEGAPNTANGSFEVDVNDTTFFTLSGFFGGSLFAQLDAISGPAGNEVEPNDLSMQASSLGYSGGVHASLEDVNDVDYYSIDVFPNSNFGNLKVWVRGVDAGCPADTSVELYDAFGGLLGSDQDDGIPTGRGGACAEIDPQRDPFATLLLGTYWIAVRSQRDEIGDYLLFTEVTPIRP